jgi:hypothetical protein
MRKHFKRWAICDAFTKLGCGIYGGSMVSYFFNKAVDLQTYLAFIGLGSVCIFVGYIGIRYFGDEKPL